MNFCPVHFISVFVRNRHKLQDRIHTLVNAGCLSLKYIVVIPVSPLDNPQLRKLTGKCWLAWSNVREFRDFLYLTLFQCLDIYLALDLFSNMVSLNDKLWGITIRNEFPHSLPVMSNYRENRRQYKRLK